MTTQTSTALNACDASIWLDKAAGTLTDISGSSNSISLNFDHDVKPFRTFGSKWPKRLECGKDAAFTINVVYSSAADEGWSVCKLWYFAAIPGARTLKIYMPNKNVGSDVFYCEARIKSFSFQLSPDEAGPVMVQMQLEPDGEVTHTVATT